jgi:hypothetical protein
VSPQHPSLVERIAPYGDVDSDRGGNRENAPGGARQSAERQYGEEDSSGQMRQYVPHVKDRRVGERPNVSGV